MIKLPPGCTVNYAITIDVQELTKDMVDWFKMVGGTVTSKESYDYRGRHQIKTYVQYGKGKACHHLVDGTGNVRLHFLGEDAGAANMFLIKYMDFVIRHNFREFEHVTY